MSDKAVAVIRGTLPEAIERVLMTGDLNPLSPEQRVVYYHHVCTSLGLNPLTRPFDYIRLNNKLQLYAKKDCTDQLRKLHGVSIEDLDDTLLGDIYRVKAKARDRDDRTDQDVGAVNVANLGGENLANAMMKACTKAKRRVTLSLCGLGMLDESEVESVSGAEVVRDPDNDGDPNAEDRGHARLISSGQISLVNVKAKAAGIDDAALHLHLNDAHGVTSLTELPFSKVNDVIKFIESKAKKKA